MSEDEIPRKKQELSQTTINSAIDSTILSQLQTQLSTKDSAFSPLNSLTDEYMIIIKKNDNIKRRINQVLKLLQSSSDEFMLIAQSSNIQKLLTVLEIVKAKIKTHENVILGEEEITLKHSKFVQYNRLESVRSKHNPNYKVTRKRENKPLKPLKDQDSFQVEHLKELGIQEKKLYKIPILYVYLKACNEIKKDDSLINNGWTFQSSV